MKLWALFRKFEAVYWTIATSGLPTFSDAAAGDHCRSWKQPVFYHYRLL